MYIPRTHCLYHLHTYDHSAPVEVVHATGSWILGFRSSSMEPGLETREFSGFWTDLWVRIAFFLLYIVFY